MFTGNGSFNDGLPRDTRMTFHSVYELPKMREWFNANKSPSEESFQGYLRELNTGPIRRQRGNISMNKLKIWWKNEKQREKRVNSRKLQTAVSSTVNVEECFSFHVPR